MCFEQTYICACTGLKYVQKGRRHGVDNDDFGGVRITSDLGDAPCMLFTFFASYLQSAYLLIMKE